MNVKLRLGEVLLLIDKQFHIEQISNQLQPIAKQADLIFAKHQVGSGYLQWTLPGSDWTAFPAGSDSQKSLVALKYKERKERMQNSLQGSFLKDIIFSVPSEDFVYFRQKGEMLEIALTAWGYKYPNRPPSRELDTWISKQELQNVNIAFVWAEQFLPEFSFKLSGHTRKTSTDGFFHVDGMLPVDGKYSIETLIGKSYTLTVEKGKSDYIFDLTEYFQIEVTAHRDNIPLPECACDINFSNIQKTAKTDTTGRVVIQLPLQSDSNGQSCSPQPPCMVLCGTETQQQVPSKDGDILHFAFNFKTEIPKPPVVDPPVVLEKNVQIKVEVFRDGKPVSGQTCEILYDGNSHTIKTDDKGEYVWNLTLKDVRTDDSSEKKYTCEVICDNLNQIKDITESTKSLIFHFDLQPQEMPPKEQEYVYIQLKDYAGMPLIDMPFILTTKKKMRVQLQTDQEGKCKVPKEWFTPKEKMKISFSVTPEYQKTHDIHDKLKQ